MSFHDYNKQEKGQKTILSLLLSWYFIFLKQLLLINNKENNVFKDGIGVKGLRFMIHGNHHGNHGNHGNHHGNPGNNYGNHGHGKHGNSSWSW